MKKYILEYRRFILAQLEKQDADWNRLLEYHKAQIEFFMHERLVHLIVTVLFAILAFLAIGAAALSGRISFIPLALLLLALLIPYIKHYWLLENQTQKLYEDYNRLYEKCFGINYKNNNDE